MLVGANDACRSSVAEMTSVAGFRAGFQRAMRALRAQAPKAQVYVASIPDLKRLWSQGRTNPLGKQVWKLGICPSMLGDADSLDAAATARRETVGKRVADYNEVLREVCAQDLRCRTDGGAVHDYRFGTEGVEPLGLVPPERDRPGQAGRDRLPRRHRETVLTGQVT
ncbi:Lipoprotein OS=Streptomyces fumanus OX=67302 GN=GCM10018772_01940 PE=4 SV=1 [Streptomyces fumanus]